jgi:hypothetical protein
MNKNKLGNELLKLSNVGPATYQDLIRLGIYSIQALANADADELYHRLQTITGCKQDPCVWDVFAAIIHEARTGIKEPWWNWTSIRKQRPIFNTK